jgi:xanthine dehydrogenase accessory factor
MSAEPYPDLFAEVVRRRQRGETVVMVTVVAVKGSTPREAGARMLLLPDGTIRGTVGGGVKESEIIGAARELFEKPAGRLLSVDFREGLQDGQGPICGGTMEVFMERIDPPRRAVIAGAGHVAYFVHRFLSLLDFQTVVVDPRPEFASAERFPGASLLVAPFDGALAGLTLTPRDAVVLVTPGHQHDRAALELALASEAGYIGMIGSKTKVAKVFEALRRKGSTDEQLARVHAPVGIDIGAETPAEIGLAIAAEVVATFRVRGA